MKMFFKLTLADAPLNSVELQLAMGRGAWLMLHSHKLVIGLL